MVFCPLAGNTPVRRNGACIWHIDSGATPQPGDELFSADMEGQACGMVANAAPAPGGGYDLLAVIQIASREAQAVHWKSPQGEALQFLPPPYPLPQD